jgi:hypothetical protein
MKDPGPTAGGKITKDHSKIRHRTINIITTINPMACSGVTQQLAEQEIYTSRCPGAILASHSVQ